MAAFSGATNRSLGGRGPAAGFRFTIYALLSVVVMFVDQRSGWLESARYVLQAAAYPIQLAVNSPSAAWNWLRTTFQERAELQAINADLLRSNRELSLRAQRYDALERENAQLRGLRAALPPVAEKYMMAEVISTELSVLRQRLVINRGSQNGVFKGQAVLALGGLVGQTIRVGPWSSEIILITDPEHAVPVQDQRNGLRTIAVGAGSSTSIGLPYIPANADVKPGDLLVTSGLGGVFPAGYPVARVLEIRRDVVQPLAQIRAVPLAQIERDREVMLVWFREGHPASPGVAGATTGSGTVQPAVAPPKPLPAPATAPAAAPASATAPASTSAPAPASTSASAPATQAPATGASTPSAATPAASAGPAGAAPPATTTPASGTSASGTPAPGPRP